MVDLIAEPPLAGLDETHGAARLTMADPGRLTWLAPWPGGETELSAALQAAHGVPFPGPGDTVSMPEGRIVWTGRSQAVLAGPEPAATLAAHGAAVDVTEVWAALCVTGDAPQVLARLVPADLRPRAFPPGRVARSLLGHISAVFVSLEDGVEVWVMRSMAETAAREIRHAMAGLAARPAP